MNKHLEGRMITPAQADILIQEGLTAADLHLHTSVSHDVPMHRKTHPRTVIETAFSRGITYPVITDHDAMQAHLAGGYAGVYAAELSVTPADLGLERPYEIHVNAYMADRHDLAVALDMASEGLYKDLILFERENPHERVLSWNHPFRPERKERLNPSLMKRFATDFRAVEVVNGKLLEGQNKYAQRMAERYDLAALAGTDNHSGSPRPMVLAPGDDFWEVMHNALEGNSYIVNRNGSSVTFAHDGLEWLDQMISGTAKEFLQLRTGDASIDETIALFIKHPGVARNFHRAMSFGVGPIKPAVLYARKKWIGPEQARFKEFSALPEVQELLYQ